VTNAVSTEVEVKDIATSVEEPVKVQEVSVAIMAKDSEALVGTTTKDNNVRSDYVAEFARIYGAEVATIVDEGSSLSWSIPKSVLAWQSKWFRAVLKPEWQVRLSSVSLGMTN
jgi:monoamine oxidase